MSWRWTRLHVDAHNTVHTGYKLATKIPVLSYATSSVGEDCAGAVQFVRPERLKELQSDTVAKEVKWLTEEDVAERLRALRADHSAWRSAQDTGQFSLAGAQPKTALLFERKRWGVPSGRVPTTHILKPPNTTVS